MVEKTSISGVATSVKRCGPNRPTPMLTIASRISQSASQTRP